MKNGILFRLAARVPFPAIKRILLQRVFRQNGGRLQDLLCLYNSRFFLYKVEGVYIPDETFTPFLSFQGQLDKCKNESLYHYIPREGDTIINLGAGIGEEILFYAQLAGNTGRVIAVEAHPEAFKVLQQTVSLNKLCNVTCVHAAIAGEEGHVSLSLDSHSYDSTSLNTGQAQKQIEVPALTAAALLDQYCPGKIALLKANIEGGERFLAATLTPEQLQRIENIAVACHDFRFRKEGHPFFQTRQLMTRFFEDHGFDIQTRQTGIDYLDDWIYGSHKK